MLGIDFGGIIHRAVQLLDLDPPPPKHVDPPPPATPNVVNADYVTKGPRASPMLVTKPQIDFVKVPAPAVKAAEEYTDKTVATAKETKQAADKLQADFGDAAPEDNQADWEMYVARRTVANGDQAKAEQAIAAELRLTYQGDPNNKEAVQNAAHDIANRYHDDPAAQAAVNKSLDTVLTETPTERATNTKLNEVNQAGTRLDDLTAQQQGGDKSVTSKQIISAREDYAAKQKELLAATRKELSATYADLPAGVKIRELDPLAYAATQMNGRYANDPEFKTVIGAATILQRVEDSAVLGNEAQVDLLGKALPKGVDPTIKGLVMADPGVQKIIDNYVKDGVKSVEDAYAQKGTVAGAEALRDVTDPSKHSAVSPEIAARIINQSKPTLEKIVDDIATRQAKGKDGQRTITDIGSGIKVAKALSAAVDVAAAGGDWEKKEYSNPEIKAAVEGIAHLIATKPASDITQLGFKDAVADGHATLALETVRQVSTLKMDEVDMGAAGKFHDAGRFEKQQGVWRDATLRAINDGLNGLKKNNEGMLDKATKGMAPLLVQGKYSQLLTEDDFVKGQRAMIEKFPGLKKDIIDGRKDIDDMGYRLLRTSEAVDFYSKDLGGMDGYKKADGTRKSLMADEKVTSTILLSDSASMRASTQIARKMLSDDLKNGGGEAQKFGIGAQLTGDLAEFLAETYVIGKVNGGVNLPGAAINASRAAHLPYFGGTVIWGVGGAFQAALTGYLFDNVQVGDVGGPLRKALLLGLVGGFAGFHLMQAGMGAARIQPHSLGDGLLGKGGDKLDTKIKNFGTKFFDAAESGESSWGLYVKEGSVRDRWTRLATEATQPLVKQLVGLMTIATAWDGSGVFMNLNGTLPFKNPDGTAATDTQQFKLGTQSVNLASDAMLLRLQVREMTLRSLGAKVMADPALKAAAETRWKIERFAFAASEGKKVAELKPHEFSFNTRLAGKYALGESGVDGAAARTALGEASATRKFLGTSKMLDVFEHLFGTGSKGNAAKWAETLSPSVRGLLFRNIVKEGATKTVGRFAVFGSNPIGWVVNIAYLGTTVANWAWDHNKNIQNFQNYDRTFMEGVGLDKAHADVMAEHDWWSSDAKVDGFLKAYATTGGDPEKFIDYINKTDTKVLGKMLEATESLTDHLDGKGNVSDANPFYDSYLALPPEPADVDLSKHPTIRFNAEKNRYEDSATGMFHEKGKLDWRLDQNGNITSYFPEERKLTFYSLAGPHTTTIHISSAAGWKNWLAARDLPLPPQAPPPSTVPPDLPAAPTVPTQNVYTVKPDDNVWDVAGNDPGVVAKIYDLNPWLNERLEASATDSGHGRNPNILNAGEILILPEGFKAHG